MSKIKKIFIKNRFSKSTIINAIATFATVIAVVFAILFIGVRLIGLTPYCVLSPSMEPKYPVGSLIYVKKIAPKDINVGDVITFVLNEEMTVATHRVTMVDTEAECFFTKGDANAAEDGTPVSYKNLIGRPVLCIPYLGYLSAFLSSSPGMYIGIASGAVLLAAVLALEFINKRSKQQHLNVAPDS